MMKGLVLAGSFPYSFPEAMASGGLGLLLSSGLASISPLGVLGVLASHELPTAHLVPPLPERPRFTPFGIRQHLRGRSVSFWDVLGKNPAL